MKAPSSPLLPAKSRCLRTFLLALGASCIVFLPFIIVDQGYFLYYGDFNVQQIPFYQMCHDAIREGNIFWSWTTDLGANFISSYSFYNLGSPFFWLTLPFPSEVVPYLMAPLLMLKTALAATTSYAYIARFVRNKDYALIGGLLYAFSGFTTYNIFFNHFHEPIVFFPLLLIGLEEYMTNGRRGVFAAAVFVNCFVNYFFFVGQVVFVIIYWFFRLLGKDWTINLKKFLWLAFEAILGVAMSAVLLIPSVLTVLANPRTSQSFQGHSALVYSWPQRYGAILECFFFPPDIPARPNFFPGAEAKWASLGAWLPLFSMCGVFSFMSAKRGHWLKRILITLFIMAMVPIFNSAFFAFNSSYYARWFYMLVLMMALATMMSLEDREVNYMVGFKITAGITFVITILIAFLPAEVEGREAQKYGLMEYPVRFWIYVAIAFVSLFLLWWLLRKFRRQPRQFATAATAAVLCISVVYSVYFIALGKVDLSETHDFIIPYALNGGEDVDLPDEDNYRIDFTDGRNLPYDNQAMFWQRPSIQAFHSVVPASIMEFYPTVGVQRDVASRPEREDYLLRPFLSVRYLFDREPMSPNDDDYDYYTYVDWQNGYYVYENKNFIPMGFCYDSFITRSEYDAMTEQERQRVLLHAAVVEDYAAQKYERTMTHYDTEEWLDTSDQAIAEDCADRREYSCETFETDNTGFTATITLPEDSEGRLLFFSVPWEEGWSAQVNGVDAVIEKTNVGFMAVWCPPGESTIRFNYMTPGLPLGLMITGVSFAVFLLYFFGMRALSRRKARRIAAVQPEEEILRHTNEDEAIETYYLKDLSLMFPAKPREDLPPEEQISPLEDRGNHPPPDNDQNT
ncbi:YfhO family protein [[Clostridium] leptum]|nr:YfhO family protein [[Clostridium] leptum]